MADTPDKTLRDAALEYHRFPKPGKLEIRATKPLANGRDLARAYSPGVAEACLETIRNETFLVLPHPQVLEYMRKKTENYDRWIGGMRKLHRMYGDRRNPQGNVS